MQPYTTELEDHLLMESFSFWLLCENLWRGNRISKAVNKYAHLSDRVLET